MSELPPFWEFVGFQDRLAAWISAEQPAADLVSIVAGWIKSQGEEPYKGMRRFTEIAANLWWGRVKGTYREGADVMVSYWIDEELRQVRCDSIATLARPN